MLSYLFIYLFFSFCLGIRLRYQEHLRLYKIGLFFCFAFYSMVYGYVDPLRTFCHMTGLLSTNFGDITVSLVINRDFSSLQKHAQPQDCIYMYIDLCRPIPQDFHHVVHSDPYLTSASAERILIDFQSKFQIKITILVPSLPICTSCRSRQSLIDKAAVGGSYIRCLSSAMLG